MPETDALLRELNHRVKNNFQIILSLINLKRRTLPPERWEDIRFIQEHVQSLAVAYRLVYASGGMFECPLADLLAGLVSELRQIARLGAGQVRLDQSRMDMQATVGLDQAVSIGSYLAVVLAPYFDRARAGAGHVRISAAMADGHLTLAIAGRNAVPVPPAPPDALRQNLEQAFFGLLHAEALPPLPEWAPEQAPEQAGEQAPEQAGQRGAGLASHHLRLRLDTSRPRPARR